MYWSPSRGAACICHSVEQQQISVHANVYFLLWIYISIFHIRAQFYFTPDADAGSNEARQWPSLGRNPRAGELAKDEEMHEAECILVQCTDSQCTVHIAHIHRSTCAVHGFSLCIQICFGQNTQKWGWDANLRRALPWNEKQREVPSNSTSTRNQPQPARKGLQKMSKNV